MNLRDLLLEFEGLHEKCIKIENILESVDGVDILSSSNRKITILVDNQKISDIKEVLEHKYINNNDFIINKNGKIVEIIII